MRLLYKYIFGKAYYFCIKVFREKEFPQFFATFIVTFAILANIAIILDIVEYILLPIRFKYYEEYYKYFALASYGIALIYIHYKKRYIQIIEFYKEIPPKKRKKLKYQSIIYLALLFIGFFLFSALIREYNISVG